jgi:hypothetical protein
VTGPADGPGRGFGRTALKVNGSIFAMLTRAHLVVKLPAARVSRLIEDGIGEQFDANRGTPMKEWLTVLVEDDASWEALAREALRFVGHR